MTTPLGWFILKRVLATVPVLGMVAVLVFLILQAAPGDPAAILAGTYATPDEIAKVRQALGLDRPMHEQFVIWLANLAHGDFGTSIFSRLPVSRLIVQRLEPTLALTVSTLVFTIVVAIPFGVLAAWRAGSWLDTCLMGFSVLGFSVPTFVAAYVLTWLFSIELGWLPVQGYVPLSDGLGACLESIALPTLATSVVFIALVARITRSSVQEVLSEDFVRTARAKGASESRVMFRHALRNSALPIATVVGYGIAFLVSGVVVTESVFNFPGIGRLVVDSVLHRDYPVIQAVILLFSFAFVLINLGVDLLYCVLDPRIRV